MKNRGKTEKLPDLEKSLNEINELINSMENQDLSLETSLEKFERGISLIKHCQKILETAEQKVQILIQKNQKEELANYECADE